MLAVNALFAFSVSATSFTCNFDEMLSGIPPVGPVPWLTAVFSDSSPGVVQLTLAAPNLTANEYVTRWYFNFNPALNPANLVFSPLGAQGQFTPPTISTGDDAFKPDHDGKYDVMLSFDGSGGQGARFSGGDAITFNITGIAGLRASDFLFGNTPAAGHGPVFTAAYVQTEAQTVLLDSLEVPVPDGTQTVILLGLVVFAVEGLRRNLQAATKLKG